MSTLRITEIIEDGSVDDAASFEFGMATRGGIRGDWEQPLETRCVTTRYPGSDGKPSRQKLGWNYGDQSFEGLWDRRHMGAGVPESTRDLFEQMVQREHDVRIEWAGDGFVGYIRKFTPAPDPNGIRWRVEYEVDRKVDRQSRPSRGGLASLGRRRTVDDWNAWVNSPASAAFKAHNKVESWRFAGRLFEAVDSKVLELRVSLAEIDKVLELRNDAKITTTGTLRNVADLMTRVQTRALSVSAELQATNSDTAAGWEDPLTVLSYEGWSRGMAADARLSGFRARKAAVDLAKQADPQVLAVYRPNRGESMMGISRKFYGTPFQWRAIYERNHLNTTNLTGREHLVIPKLAGVPRG